MTQATHTHPHIIFNANAQARAGPARRGFANTAGRTSCWHNLLKKDRYVGFLLNFGTRQHFHFTLY